MPKSHRKKGLIGYLVGPWPVLALKPSFRKERAENSTVSGIWRGFF